MEKLIVTIAGLILTTATVEAFQIAPECKKFRDPIGCTCAIQNGGSITVQKGGGERWYSKRGGSRTATNEAFVQCNIRARGH